MTELRLNAPPGSSHPEAKRGETFVMYATCTGAAGMGMRLRAGTKVLDDDGTDVTGDCTDDTGRLEIAPYFSRTRDLVALHKRLYTH